MPQMSNDRGKRFVRRSGLTKGSWRRRLGALLVGSLASISLFSTDGAGLTLEQAVQLALTRNERSRAAEMRVSAAEARVDKARTLFLPDLIATGNYTRRAYQTFRVVEGQRFPIQRYNVWSPRGVLTFNLYDPSAAPLYRQVRRENQATRLTAANDKRLLAFEAANAFLTALSMEQVLEAARRRLEFAKRSLADTRARFEAQLVSSNDVTRAELELATAERELTRTQGGMETASLQLGYLLNTKVEGPIEMPVSLLQAAATPPDPGTGVVAEALKRRQDVAAIRQHTDALRAAASEPLLRFLPSLRMTGQYTMTNESGLSGRNRDWLIGLALTWNMYDGGERFADRAERQALADAADLDAQALERRVDVELNTALVVLANEQAAVKQAGVAADVARTNMEQATELYRQGLASALEVADANVRLFEAEVALVRERYGLTLAYLDWRAALGLDPLGKE